MTCRVRGHSTAGAMPHTGMSLRRLIKFASGCRSFPSALREHLKTMPLEYEPEFSGDADD